jgi:uncharacterized repeat protein (TIGR01451 family)
MIRPRLRGFCLVAVLALVAVGVAAATARADAPDVKVNSPAPGQHPFQTGTATVDTVTGHVTVTLTGGWSWPTHGVDCNTNRSGAGVAVNWFDPQDRGFHVAFFNVNGGSPDTTPGGPDDFGIGSTGASGLNAIDDVVHPTENDTGTGAVVDITTPADVANWRGGCGLFSSDTILVNNNNVLSYTTAIVSHGNFGQVAPGSVDESGAPFDNPTPPSDPSLRGALLQHVYASKADVTMACALMYDVHPGTNADDNDGVGIPKETKEVTGGDQAVASGASYTNIHNNDNSITQNGGTPAGNSCPTFSFPPNFPSLATSLSESTGAVGDAVHDSATLTDATSDAAGTVTYNVYSDSSCKNLFAAAGTVDVVDASVPDSNPITFDTAGTYYWQATYSGDANNTGTQSACTDEQLDITTPSIDLAVTKSGSPATQELGTGNITWTMVVTNNGPSTATDVEATDAMPAGNTFVSASSTQGTCTGGATLTCDIGTMAEGATVTITLVTTPSVEGTQSNTVTVTGHEPETNPDNNQATATVEITPSGVKPPIKPCVAVSRVSPKQLFVGRKTTLHIRISQGGKAKAGVRVKIKGPKLNITTKRSNHKGAIKQVVKVKKAGVLIFTPIASKKCSTKRVGVTGVFTPPVTG